MPVGDARHQVGQGENLLVPAGQYSGVHNPGSERLALQQVSGPKPWDSRLLGLHPRQSAP